MKQKKGQMARKLVYYCVTILTAAAVWAAVVKTRDSAADLSDVLTFVGAAFGGELLMLLLKRVFAKEDTSSVAADAAPPSPQGEGFFETEEQTWSN